MTYPIDIRSGRRHHVFSTLCCLLILGVVLVFMTTIGQSHREAVMLDRFTDIREMGASGTSTEDASGNFLVNLKTIFLYILCTAIAGLLAFVAFLMGNMAYSNPITATFDQRGVTLINNSIRNFEDMRIDWSEVGSVEFYSRRMNHSKIRLVRLVLNENKEVRKASVQDSSSSSNEISHAIKRKLRGVVDLPYTGKGMGLSHEDYFEFVKSEFSKNKRTAPRYGYSTHSTGHGAGRGGRLFG